MTTFAYRPEIDGLRAIAVVPVILFHAGLTPFSGGFVGVDVFFVISGYLITSIIWREMQSGTFSLLQFYERRARRILPPLYLVLFLTMPLAWFWMMPEAYEDYSEGLIGVITFSSNIVFWLQTGYFAPVAEENALLHTWSLSVEEQFYLLFPLFLLFFVALSRFWLIAVLAVGCIVSLALAQYSSAANPTSNFYLLPSRAWELGIGALLALLPQPKIARRFSSLLSLVGITLIFGSIFMLDNTTPFPSLWTLPCVLGTVMVMAFSNTSEPVGKILGCKPLVWIGLLSYSAYLFHQPLFAFARILTDHSLPHWLIAVLILMTVALAQLSYVFVESPFRNRKLTSPKTLTLTLVPAAGFVVAFGIMGILTDGASFRKNGLAGSLAAKIAYNTGLSDRCNHAFTLEEACRTSETPNVVVWGDSYAKHLIDMFQAVDPSIELIQHTKSACAPVLDLAPIADSNRNRTWAEGCIQFNQDVSEWIINSPSVDRVILSSPFRAYVGENKRLLLNNSVERGNAQLVSRELLETVSFLERHDIEVMLVTSPPSNGNNMGKCLSQKVWTNGDPTECKILMQDYLSYDAEALKIWNEMRKLKNLVFLADHMCSEGVCVAYANETLLYMDHGHLSRSGSRYLAEQPELRALIEDFLE